MLKVNYFSSGGELWKSRLRPETKVFQNFCASEVTWRVRILSRDESAVDLIARFTLTVDPSFTSDLFWFSFWSPIFIWYLSAFSNREFNFKILHNFEKCNLFRKTNFFYTHFYAQSFQSINVSKFIKFSKNKIRDILTKF